MNTSDIDTLISNSDLLNTEISSEVFEYICKKLNVIYSIDNSIKEYRNTLVIGYTRNYNSAQNFSHGFFPYILDFKTVNYCSESNLELIFILFCKYLKVKYILFTNHTWYNVGKLLVNMKKENKINCKLLFSVFFSRDYDDYEYIDIIYDYNKIFIKKISELSNFGIPKKYHSKIKFFPYTTQVVIPNFVDNAVIEMCNEPFILGVGKNCRDWTRVIEACNILNQRLIILDTNIDDLDIKENKYIKKHKTDRNTCNYFIQKCTFVVIPIKDDHLNVSCVGVTVITKANLLGKIGIGTLDCGLDRFIKHNYDGLLIRNTIEDYKESINYLLENNRYKEFEKNINLVKFSYEYCRKKITKYLT
jgi:hypothetical protein